MRFDVPAWSATYAHDRRAHRHRCRVCNRIVEAGEPVFMARVKAKKTWTIHDACADKQHGTAAWTWRDAMRWWAFEYQVKCYGRNFFNHRDHAQIEKYRVAAGVMQPPRPELSAISLT